MQLSVQKDIYLKQFDVYEAKALEVANVRFLVFCQTRIAIIRILRSLVFKNSTDYQSSLLTQKLSLKDF